MTLDEYQTKARTFASYGGNPMYAYLNLAGEVGELIERAVVRLDPMCMVMGEDGDCRWQIAAVASENGISLEELDTECELDADVYDDLVITMSKVMALTGKFIRKNDGMTPQVASRWVTRKETSERYRKDLTALLGRMWRCLDEIADAIGYTPDESMLHNIEKLTDRKRTGTIIGSGETVEERKRNSRADT